MVRLLLIESHGGDIADELDRNEETMAHIIDNATFRALRNCRKIESLNATILNGLSNFRSNTEEMRVVLEEMRETLLDSSKHFDEARERLAESKANHAEVMKQVDAIMATSVAFSK